MGVELAMSATTDLVHIASGNGMPIPVKVPSGVIEWGDRKLDNWIRRSASAASTHRAAFEQHAILTGYGLMIRRERCGSRGFKPWLDEHFDGDKATAYRYIAAAESVGLSVAPTRQIEPGESEPASEFDDEPEPIDGEVVDDGEPAPPGHSPLGMSPDATPVHQLRENVVFLVDRAREIGHQIEAGIEIRSLDNGDRKSLLAGLALVEQIVDQIRRGVQCPE